MAGLRSSALGSGVSVSGIASRRGGMRAGIGSRTQIASEVKNRGF